MAKARLSRRPLKRIVRFEIQLGPYSWQYRDGKERPAEQYTIWTAELPKGKKHPRFIAVLQKMNPPGRFADRVHNPVLFQQVVVLSGAQDAEYKAKWALHNAQAAAYWLLKKRLLQLSRTLIKWRWTTHYELLDAWETIDPPSESKFEDWHLDAMHKLSHFLGDWKHYMEPFGYLGLLGPTGSRGGTGRRQKTTSFWLWHDPMG